MGQGRGFGSVFQPRIVTQRPLMASPGSSVQRSQSVTRRSKFGSRMTRIRDLNEFQRNWAVIARCTTKSHMRKFLNQRGEGAKRLIFGTRRVKNRQIVQF